MSAHRRSRAGVPHTVTLGSSALSPTVYGLLSDAAGVVVTLLVVAAVVLLAVPLALALRAALATPKP